MPNCAAVAADEIGISVEDLINGARPRELPEARVIEAVEAHGDALEARVS